MVEGVNRPGKVAEWTVCMRASRVGSSDGIESMGSLFEYCSLVESGFGWYVEQHVSSKGIALTLVVAES